MIKYIYKICLLIILIVLIVNKFKINNCENFENQIPLHIYQTWHTKDLLPPKMRKCVEKLKTDNPEFEHHLYDNKECHHFIKTNFDKRVLNAFNKLKPGAFKADLWRYCILYKKGGIYLDIKYQCEPKFKLIDLAKNTPVKEIDPKSINYDFSSREEDPEKTKDRVSKANLEYPIIVVKNEAGKIFAMLDGTHRLEKALNLNLDKIKTKILDKEDLIQFKTDKIK